MLVLSLRTDKPEAEIGLYQDGTVLAYVTWQAHRQLAETLHHKIKEVLEAQQKQLSDLDGIAAYKGPGSFTGLRIGLSVANALAASYELPIIGSSGEQWQEDAIGRLNRKETEEYVVPEYGADVHITTQKK